MERGARDRDMDSLERGPCDTFPFLKLSAELRSRAYHYASEQASSGELSPVLPSSTSGVGPGIHNIKGLAFTQVCQQVRHEYRPIYMQKAVMKVNWKHWDKFDNTFYPKTEDFRNGPAEFKVMFGALGTGQHGPIDLTRLFHVHLHFKAIKFVIVPYEGTKRTSPVFDKWIVDWQEYANALLASRHKAWIKEFGQNIFEMYIESHLLGIQVEAGIHFTPIDAPDYNENCNKDKSTSLGPIDH